MDGTNYNEWTRTITLVHDGKSKFGYLRGKLLGIKVAHSKKGIFTSQQKFIDLLQETGKTACKSANTPIDPSVKLKNTGEDIAVNREMYQRLLGKLIYFSN